MNGENEKNSYFMKHIYVHYEYIYKRIYFATKSEGLAQDISQSVMEKAWNRLEEIKEYQYLRAWLGTVAKNEMISYIRKNNKVVLGNEELQAYFSNLKEPPECDALQYLIEAEKFKELREALCILKEIDIQILKMKYIQGKTYEEIGSALGLKGSSVRSRSQRALNRLKGQLNIT